MEYWHDIYGLSENRDVATIEAFLRHFTDRNRIEDNRNEVITLIPDIPTPEKDKLLKPIYAYANGSPHHNKPSLPNGLTSLTEPETVTVDMLSQAIALGVARKNQAFSLYLPSYTHAGVNRLIVHFTLDNQVVLGLSVSERTSYDRFSRFRLVNRLEEKPDQENMLLMQKLRDEMAAVIPLKATAITFEQRAPDNEQEFMNLKIFYERMDEFTKNILRRRPLAKNDYQDGNYYAKYRNQIHRQSPPREQKERPVINLFDNFSVGNCQGQVLSVITAHGDFIGHEQVQNPEWKDVVKLPYLGDLLRKAVSCTNEKFQLSAIHRVSIPLTTAVEYLWEGHRDGVSDFTTFRGLKAAEVVIEETYCLDKIEDLKRLAGEGFFKYSETFFHQSTTKAYQAWLTKYGNTDLFLTLQREPSFPWYPDVKALLSLEGKQDWQQFLSYLQQCKTSNKGLKDLLTEMCTSDSWQTWQVKDILQMVSLTQPELQDLLDTIARYYRFELFELLYAQKQTPSPFPHLVKQIKDAFKERKSPEEAAKFISLYLQEIEKVYSTFYDYSIIYTLTATEAYQELLPTVLKILPGKNQHRQKLLNIALATENRYLLRMLAFSSAEIENLRLEEEALIQQTSEDFVSLIKKATEAGNYFKVAYLAPQIAPESLLTPMLHASKMGMLGIVKVLVEQGKVAPDCWDNYPIKCANKGGFQKLKQYLLSKGVKNKVFIR